MFQYFHKGARGQEIIPHVAFWKDLPFLIKVCAVWLLGQWFAFWYYHVLFLQDGILFTIQPCYRRNYEKC